MEINTEELKFYLINEIKKDIDLSKHNNCIIAGGYLLGLVVEYMNWGKRNYNDIDIFKIITNYEDDKIKQFIRNNLSRDSYSFFIKNDNNYCIYEEKKDEFFNEISMITSVQFNWTALINDFDITNIQIGMKYSNGVFDLYFTPEFSKFLLDKHIARCFREKNVSTNNLRTCVRMYIKKEQYPFLILNPNLFNNMILTSTNYFNIKNICCNNLGKEKLVFLKKLIKNNPCFEIIENNTCFIIDNKVSSTYLTIKNNINEYNNTNIASFLMKHKKINLKKSELQRLSKLKELGFLNEKNNLTRLFIKYPLLDLDINNIDLQSIYKICNHNSERLINFFWKMISNEINYHQFIEIIRFLNKNTDYIAFIEQNYWDSTIFTSLNELKRIKYKKEKEEMKKANLNKINDFFIYNKYITELNTKTSLENESKFMNHCVRGYWSRVFSGQENIFHINYKDNHSTFSIIKLNNKYIISQHKGKFNQNPYSKNKLVAILFVNFLNQHKK